MMTASTIKDELLALSNTELNRAVSIKDTDYNRNVKYGTRTKTNWKLLYNATGLGKMTAKEIADAYGASVQTVRMVVDPEYADKVKAAKVQYNKNYVNKHGSRIYSHEYQTELIERKRRLIASEDLAHLKAL